MPPGFHPGNRVLAIKRKVKEALAQLCFLWGGSEFTHCYFTCSRGRNDRLRILAKPWGALSPRLNGSPQPSGTSDHARKQVGRSPPGSLPTSSPILTSALQRQKHCPSVPRCRVPCCPTSRSSPGHKARAEQPALRLFPWPAAPGGNSEAGSRGSHTLLLASATRVHPAPGNGVYEGRQQQGEGARNHCLTDTAIEAKPSSNLPDSSFHLKGIRFISI